MKTSDREFTVDRLRGYALLGIILVNAPFLLTSINGFTNASAPSLGDRIAWFSVAAFFQAKSYVILVMIPLRKRSDRTILLVAAASS